MVTFDEFLALGLSLPQTAERPTWGELTLRVGEKMFAVGAEGSDSVSIKASPADQAELLAAAPQVYSKAPYVGRFGWVRVRLDLADPEELRDLVTEAWRRTAPKKLVREFDAAQPSNGRRPGDSSAL
ncbi:MmcQ/YjbR family DNA-binding protein [Kitasatospora azatica]|uniref:MmcQ/YjbR family DNA-binding protein n=1 Tax=Kitasatospora azatica TaxID=58347 RepID=UPI00055EF575|nr:MmcQ/YjbR family DNA-binding protein [Kitasatospora azatica]